MKKLLFLLPLALCLTAGAQTTPQTPQQTFFESVSQYFTSFNTNLAWTNGSDAVNFWAGTDNLDNERMTANLGIAWNVASSLSLEGVMRNATTAGTVLTTQAGLGWNIVKVDTKLTPYLHGGYRFDSHEWYVAPGLRVSKMLTLNTFAGVSLELDINLKHTQANLNPTFGIFAGFRL